MIDTQNNATEGSESRYDKTAHGWLNMQVRKHFTYRHGISNVDNDKVFILPAGNK